MARKKAKKKAKSVRTRPEKPLLSYNEQRRVEKEIAADQNYLRGLTSHPGGRSDGPVEAYLPGNQTGRTVDTGNIQRRIKRNQKALQDMSPANHKLKGKDRQRAHEQMQEDAEWLRENMLSTWDMGAFPSATDPEKQQKYKLALEKSVKQEVGNPEFIRRSSRYKKLARMLDPDDTELCNIERLRSTKRY